MNSSNNYVMGDMLCMALSQYGIKEIVGSKHNAEVLKYFSEIGHSWVKNDELAWCSAFINWCAKMTGYEYTGKLNARSWLKIGETLDKPEIGCIAVLWRNGKNSPYGHVGLFIAEDGDNICILGGNQNNQVKIARYPKNRVLSYRKLNKIA